MQTEDLTKRQNLISKGFNYFRFNLIKLIGGEVVSSTEVVLLDASRQCAKSDTELFDIIRNTIIDYKKKQL